MTSKRFQFWRVLVALAHADHTITEEERNFICEKFNYLDFTDSEKQQLIDELADSQDVFPLFDSLESAEERAECLYMAHNLINIDDDVHDWEEKLYSRMMSNHMATLNHSTIKTDYKTLLKDQETRRQAEEEELKAYQDEYDFLSGWHRWFKK